MRLMRLFEAGEEYHHSWDRPAVPSGWTRSETSIGHPYYQHTSGALIELGGVKGQKRWLLYLQNAKPNQYGRPIPQWNFPPTPEGLKEAFKTFVEKPPTQAKLPGLRDPELEKQLGAKISAPISMWSGKRPADYAPSVVSSGDLNRATRHWLRSFNGERWPDLEKAIMARANTYRATGGDYTKPRIALFTYLNNLKEPWPEGDLMARQFIADVDARGTPNRGISSALGHPDTIEYIRKKHILTPPGQTLPGVKHLEPEE